MKNKLSKLGKTIDEWGVFIELKDGTTAEIVLSEELANGVANFLFNKSKQTDLCGHRDNTIDTHGRIVW